MSHKSKFMVIGLAGPLHGLANQEVLVFLSKVRQLLITSHFERGGGQYSLESLQIKISDSITIIIGCQ